MWVTQKTTGATGQIALSLRIDNKTASTVDVSTVTLRYWYQDEGLGTNLVLAANYVSIGYSNQGKVTSGTAVANPSPVAGADHYLELAFTGTLAAQGDKATNDQFNIQVTLHTSGYTGAVDVTNDYSYDGGAAAVYEQKITLHDKTGKSRLGNSAGQGRLASRRWLVTADSFLESCHLVATCVILLCHHANNQALLKSQALRHL